MRGQTRLVRQTGWWLRRGGEAAGALPASGRAFDARAIGEAGAGKGHDTHAPRVTGGEATTAGRQARECVWKSVFCARTYIHT